MIEIGNQTIIHGDCRDVMKQMLVGSVDCIITSPPYNLGMAYANYDDWLNNKNYFEMLREAFSMVSWVLKSDGSFFLNAGFPASNPWLSYDIAKEASRYLCLQNRICWVKSIAIGDEPCTGHVKPVNSERFLNRQWEEIFHFTQKGNTKLDRLAVGVPYADKSNLERGSRGKNGDKRCRGDVWFLPYTTVQSKEDRGSHPATFPLQLALNCIKLHGVRPDMIVLDPFVGSGSTLIACQQLGVTGIGIDCDAESIRVCEKRLKENVSR